MTAEQREALEQEYYELKRTASLKDKEAIARIKELRNMLEIEAPKATAKKSWLDSDCRKYARYF